MRLTLRAIKFDHNILLNLEINPVVRRWALSKIGIGVSIKIFFVAVRVISISMADWKKVVKKAVPFV